ncbi:solute carrier family 13 (sodium-dependent dicarboxylate transporter), member 2/3/5 [Nitrosomonas aestuarii]|uniref:Solute carrier family 13 (Sodium-dependent dicarboxylate transporter), member 2/3/5 n=1 Tax=Nitrosomonas aestuarii TaxID=52441 RepID=A0A1I3WY65_9PROT|nr:DASS family sodium-coupled anion symporter [Nitrosomonas aestuarii]SFK12425.1 solute carrier family 13 (sodium-dependent dicarboxylate transporter), member 2/3/5 [Nitrosomonas aestuarii]
MVPFTLPKKFGLIAGVSFLVMTILSPAPAEMSESAWRTTGVAMLLAIWWATEVLPIPVTSLLPVLLFPALGIMSMENSTAPYAAPAIFLLMGGFIIATGLAKWDLHRRIALNILIRVGNSPAALIAGFMGTTALISMWISNTASTLMMIPIALSLAGEMVKDEIDQHHKFILCLILGIAYSASIGGLGTIIGTPPNLFVVSFMRQNYGIDISFVDWMMFGVPVVIVMTTLAWWVLTKWTFSFDLQGEKLSKKTIIEELEKLGKMTQPEMRITYVFTFVAMAWILRVPVQEHFEVLLWLNDAMIAVGGAVLMFIIPAGQTVPKKVTALMDWESASKIPWGVLLLFGGGLSLAEGIKSTGLADWIGAGLSGLPHLDLIIMMLVLVTLVIFLTELTSNTATTATLLPILGVLAVSSGIDPMLLFAPTALAASCAFMLPVATAPNAVVYSTGQVTISQMAHAGLKLNLVAIVVVTGLSYALIPWVFE